MCIKFTFNIEFAIPASSCSTICPKQPLSSDKLGSVTMMLENDHHPVPSNDEEDAKYIDDNGISEAE